MDFDSEPSVKLQSNDGIIGAIHLRAALESEVLNSNFGDMLEDEDETVVLPNVNGATLLKVIEFLEEYSFGQKLEKIPQPIPWPKRLPDVVSPPYYAHYIMTLTHRELVEVLLAADYLAIPPLMELCSARLGRLLMNRTPEEALQLLQSEVDDRSTHTPLSLSMLSAAEREQLLSSLHWSVPAAATTSTSPGRSVSSAGGGIVTSKQLPACPLDEEGDDDEDTAEPACLLRKMHQRRAEDMQQRPQYHEQQRKLDLIRAASKAAPAARESTGSVEVEADAMFTVGMEPST